MKKRQLAALPLLCLTAAGCGNAERACREGESRCTETVIERCRDNSWVAETDCASEGKECLLDEGVAVCHPSAVCQEGEQRCSGDIREQCSEGAWRRMEDCNYPPNETPKRCVADAGRTWCEYIPECQDGEERCAGYWVSDCVSGSWNMKEDCSASGRVCQEEYGTAYCRALPECEEGRLRCQGDRLQRCQQGAWTEQEDCAASLGWCAVGVPDASCARLGWQHLKVAIDDPVIQGGSLFLPVDGPSFGYDAASGLFATAFGHEYESPYQAHLWLVEEAGGVHRKVLLSGDPLAAGTNFCGGEDWCQFLSFDPRLGQFVVVGPSAPALMRIAPDGATAQVDLSGTLQPDSYIDRIHFFDWLARRLWLYGALGPSSLSTALYSLDLDGGIWNRTAAGLRPVFANCLVVDSAGGRVFSFAGRTSSDGGNTTEWLGSYDVFAPDGSGLQTLALPAGIGAREGMACALDMARGVIYLFGGAVVRDSFDEAQNDYHNDLWALRLSDGAWFQLVVDSPGGTFSPPDQYGDRRFEAFPQGPNFGKNRGYLIYDSTSDRLAIAGEVPVFTHGQLYTMELAGVERILDRAP